MALQGESMTASVGGPKRPVARAERRTAASSASFDREHAFVKAGRRSARIRLLRKAILASGLGAVAAMVLVAVYNPFSTKLGSLSFSGVAIEGTKITMARPKLAGFRNDGQAYTLTAEKALQDVMHPTVVELQKVTGEIGATGGEPTRLSADAGIYDTVAERMKLSSNVRIGSSRVDVRLQSADIDFKTGVYLSNDPVEVHVGAGTTITGDRATARDNGQELIFEGRVRTTIIPSTGSTADADTKGTSP